MGGRHWSDDDLRDVVRAAAVECDAPLRQASYRAWAKAHPERQPTSELIVHRLGPWVAVLEELGLPVDRRYRLWR